MKHIDWLQVQAYYDAGHTIAETQKIFGFGYKRRGKAISNGDLLLRSRSQQQQLSKSKATSKWPTDLDIDKAKQAAKLYAEGFSTRDLMAAGLRYVHYQLAVDMKLINKRSLSEANKNRVATKGQNTMSHKARRNLSIRQSLNNSGGKSKWYEVAGQKVQGTWERDIALKLEELGIRWYKPKINKDVWSYTLDGKTRSYTPDIHLVDLDIYLEIKGYWWGNDRAKMDAVMEQHSEKKLLIIEKKEYKKIVGGELVW